MEFFLLFTFPNVLFYFCAAGGRVKPPGMGVRSYHYQHKVYCPFTSRGAFNDGGAFIFPKTSSSVCFPSRQSKEQDNQQISISRIGNLKKERKKGERAWRRKRKTFNELQTITRQMLRICLSFVQLFFSKPIFASDLSLSQKKSIKKIWKLKQERRRDAKTCGNLSAFQSAPIGT